MSRSARLTLLAIVLALGCARAKAEGAWKGWQLTCSPEDRDEAANASATCHGIRLVRKIVQKMLEEAKRKRSLDIVEGVSLVESEDARESTRDGRLLKNLGPIGWVVGFLENRELKIKLRSLLPDNLEAVVEKSLTSIDQARGHGDKGGGGGKKGDNGIMILVIMMGKMIAAMGFGALGMMAMKALMLSSIALVLSLVIAAKKITSKDEDSHHVVYAQEHHRRRRSSPFLYDNSENQPYRGYMLSSAELTKF